MTIGYAGLFLVAFVAATILPAQSELVLAGLVLAEGYDLGLLLLVATIGNVLGSVVNWAIGRFASRYRGARWFPVPPRALARAERWYARWGLWTLLLSWAPVGGDALTLVAGILRAPIGKFVAVVTIAKAARYVVVIWVATGASGLGSR